MEFESLQRGASCTVPDAAQEPAPAPSASDNGPAPAAATAQSRSEQANPPPAGVKLCDEDSPALAEARRQYDALEQLVEALPPDGSTTAFNKQVTALYEHACLAVRAATSR